MGFVQRVVQMAEMTDAKSRDLKNKDRIAVLAQRFGVEAECANVGRDIADQHIADGQRMMRRLSIVAPAVQHMCDVRIGIERVMGRMGAVHRHHIGRLARRISAAEVGGDGDVARRLDDVSRMAGIGDRHRTVSCRHTREVCIHHARQ